MPHYFAPFPTVAYDPTGENVPVLCTDITKRFKISEAIKGRKLVFYDYQVKEHDRPDVVAEKYYGDATLDWLLFITNGVFDPYFGWPLNYAQLQDFIRQKYGSVSTAMSQIHHYEYIVAPRKEYYENYDSSIVMIPEQTVIIDYTTYASLTAAERRQVTAYEYEEATNNDKRNIKILDKAFVPGLLRDFRRIFT